MLYSYKVVFMLNAHTQTSETVLADSAYSAKELIRAKYPCNSIVFISAVIVK